MSALMEAERVLRQSGYGIDLPAGGPNWLFFEDDSVLGFVVELNSAAEISARWSGLQDEFLKRHGVRLKAHQGKAWNVYAVFLSAETASSEEQSSLTAIEHDFRATRKIARAGVDSRAKCYTALAPLLALPTPPPPTAKAIEALRGRLTDHEVILLSKLMAEDSDPEEVLEWLILLG